MSRVRQALLVAGWEFQRYFKWRDQALGLIVFMVIGAAAYGAGILATATGRTITVAVDGMHARRNGDTQLYAELLIPILICIT